MSEPSSSTVIRAGGAGAAVVVMPSAFGVTPDLVAQMEELARDASIVVALDPFAASDPGPAPYDDMARVMSRLRSLDRARAADDLRATIASSRAVHDRVIVVGICVGGPFAIDAAADGAVDGAITWHATYLDQHLHRAPEIRVPLRLHFGDADPFVPPAVVDAVRAAFADHPGAHVIVHRGATHGFSHPGSPRSYDPAAERAAIASVRELILAS